MKSREQTGFPWDLNGERWKGTSADGEPEWVAPYGGRGGLQAEHCTHARTHTHIHMPMRSLQGLSSTVLFALGPLQHQAERAD